MNANDRLDEVLRKLKGASPSGSRPHQYAAYCPAHNDSDKSFVAGIGDNGHVCLRCFTGCEIGDILAALDMTPRDLFADNEGQPFVASTTPAVDPHDPPEVWEERCAAWAANFAAAPSVRARLASILDIPESAFAKFPGLGARADHERGACFTFPECDAQGRITGMGLRFMNGDKRSDSKSKRGLTLPDNWCDHTKPLYIVEGPSDVLAMIAAGCCAIGRPGVAGGVKPLAELIRNQVPTTRRIIFMGENDELKPSKKNPNISERVGHVESLKAARKLAAEVPEHKIEWAIPPSTEDKDMRRWATRLVMDGCQWCEIESRLNQFLKPQKIKKGGGTVEDGEDKITTARDIINIDEKNQLLTNNQALESLKRDENLYARGNMLVRVIHTPGKVRYRKDKKTGKQVPVMVTPAKSRLSELEEATLQERISALADFQVTVAKKGKDKDGKPFTGTMLKSVDIPKWCVSAVHAREDWPMLKNLTALVDYPVLRPDGTIWATRGHDEVTGVFYNHSGEIKIPENPTRADALAAWARLKMVVSDFPFQTPDIHLAAWLAALLTPMTRFAFNGCVPIFLIDGNIAGAGKGLLADTISLILTGRPFATMGYTDDNVEMSKRITAIAVEGEQLVMFDNINQGFGGSAIDRALTSLEWSERILGTSRNVKCPLQIGWYGTGNNVELVGDILRRLCQIRLESPVAKPEERKDFTIKDLRAWIMFNRDSLLADAATILAAYYADGAPQADLKSWGRFEAWSGIVRQAVVWLGLSDPMDTRDHIMTDTDVGKTAIVTIIENWRKIDVDGCGLTTSQILNVVLPPWEDGKPVKTPDNLTDVADALKQLMHKPSARGLGVHFSKYRATRFTDGLYLTTKPKEDRSGSLVWEVHESETKRMVRKDWRPTKKAKPEATSAGSAGFEGDNPISGMGRDSDEKNPSRGVINSPSNPALPANENSSDTGSDYVFGQDEPLP